MRIQVKSLCLFIGLMSLLPVLGLYAQNRQPVVPVKFSILSEVPFYKVHVRDKFWTPRIKKVQDITIPDLLEIAEAQGKFDNLRIIAGIKKDGRIRMYNSPDSDIWKIMEAASYSLAQRPDPVLDKKLDEIIALYKKVQADDGYINQMFMLADDDPRSPKNGGKARLGYGADQRFKGTIKQWPSGLGQLYCAGHLFESAAAHYRATGKRNFLLIATRMADCIHKRFPPGKPIDYADHPQVGIGLIKLYEVTGNKKYLDLADHIVHHGHHGRPPDFGSGESLKPIEEQRIAWGHAVRISYLYSAATDLCRFLGEPGTRDALNSLWHSIVDKRIYVTGGIGGPAPAEQLAHDYVLDNFRCYCECCSNIAFGQWNHRLNLLYGDADYADIVEIEAYNAGLSGISLGGRKYFYSNKLAVRKKRPKNRFAGVRERYLFCCPAKLPVLLEGISRWIYAKNEKGIFVNLYIGGTAGIDLPRGRVKLSQQTNYPWKGDVKITVDPVVEQAGGKRGNRRMLGIFDLYLRIPGWARGRPFPSDLYRYENPGAVDLNVKVNGKTIVSPSVEKGYIRISRKWKPGDHVVLHMPMPVRRIYARKEVQQDRGRVALMRGPLVYCLEGIDQKFSVFNLIIPSKSRITEEHLDGLLGGITVLRGRGLLKEKGKKEKQSVEFTAVPYYAWQNRGIDEMTVWILEGPDDSLGDAGGH